jgi:hypothetical protein
MLSTMGLIESCIGFEGREAFAETGHTHSSSRLAIFLGLVSDGKASGSTWWIGIAAMTHVGDSILEMDDGKVV